MGRHWEKKIAKARAAVSAVGVRHERSEPMLRPEVESFIRGFNLSEAATKLIVDEWMADQGRARSEGYDDAYSQCME